MTVGLTLPLPDGLAAPYAVPAKDWKAIEDRLSIAIEAEGISAEIERYVPNYRTLLAVCTAWRDSTFPALLAQAFTVELFAKKAASVMTELSGLLTNLTPADPVPEPVRFLIRIEFAALAQSAGEGAEKASKLEGAVQAFVAANQETDDALEEVPLGDWHSIAGPIGALESGINSISASWSPVAAQLHEVAETTLTITTAELLSSNLAEAIGAYQLLASEASAFIAIASQLVPSE